MILNFEHLIYGESPNPDYTGFQILAASTGLDPGDQQALRQRVNVGHALAMESGPYRHHAYDVLPSGRVAFNVRVPGVLEGRDSVEARRKIISHAFVADVATFRKIESPFQVFSSETSVSWTSGRGALGLFWNSENFRNVREVVQYQPLEIEIEPVSASTGAWLWRGAALASLRERLSEESLARSAAAILHRWLGGRNVVLSATSGWVHEDLIRLVWLTLPATDRLATSFSTHAVPFQWADYSFCAVPAEYISDPIVAPNFLRLDDGIDRTDTARPEARLAGDWLAAGDWESLKRLFAAAVDLPWRARPDLPLRIDRQAKFHKGQVRIATPEDLEQVLDLHAGNTGSVDAGVDVGLLDGALQRDLRSLEPVAESAHLDEWANSARVGMKRFNSSARATIFKKWWQAEIGRAWVIGVLITLLVDEGDRSILPLIQEGEEQALKWLERHFPDARRFVEWAVKCDESRASREWAASLGVRATFASASEDELRLLYKQVATDLSLFRSVIANVRGVAPPLHREIATQEFLRGAASAGDRAALESLATTDADAMSPSSAVTFLKAISGKTVASRTLHDRALDIIDKHLTLSALDSAVIDEFAGYLARAVSHSDATVAALATKHSGKHSRLWVLLGNEAAVGPTTSTFAALLECGDPAVSRSILLRVLDAAAEHPLDQDVDASWRRAVDSMNRGADFETLLAALPLSKAIHFQLRLLLDGRLRPAASRRCQRNISAATKEGCVVPHGWATVPWERLGSLYPEFAASLVETLVRRGELGTRGLKMTDPALLRAVIRVRLQLKASRRWSGEPLLLTTSLRQGLSPYELEVVRLFEATIRDADVEAM